MIEALSKMMGDSNMDDNSDVKGDECWLIQASQEGDLSRVQEILEEGRRVDINAGRYLERESITCGMQCRSFGNSHDIDREWCRSQY